MPSPSDIKAGLAAAASKAASGTSRAQAGAPPPGGPQGVFDLNGTPVSGVVFNDSFVPTYSGGTSLIERRDEIIFRPTLGLDDWDDLVPIWTAEYGVGGKRRKIILSPGNYKAGTNGLMPPGLQLECMPGVDIECTYTPRGSPLAPYVGPFVADLIDVYGSSFHLSANAVEGARTITATMSQAPQVGQVIIIQRASVGWPAEGFEIVKVTGSGTYTMTLDHEITYPFTTADDCRLNTPNRGIKLTGNGARIWGPNERMLSIACAWDCIVDGFTVDAAGSTEFPCSLDTGSGRSTARNGITKNSATTAAYYCESAYKCRLENWNSQNNFQAFGVWGTHHQVINCTATAYSNAAGTFGLVIGHPGTSRDAGATRHVIVKNFRANGFQNGIISFGSQQSQIINPNVTSCTIGLLVTSTATENVPTRGLVVTGGNLSLNANQGAVIQSGCSAEFVGVTATRNIHEIDIQAGGKLKIRGGYYAPSTSDTCISNAGELTIDGATLDGSAYGSGSTNYLVSTSGAHTTIASNIVFVAGTTSDIAMTSGGTGIAYTTNIVLQGTFAQGMLIDTSAFWWRGSNSRFEAATTPFVGTGQRNFGVATLNGSTPVSLPFTPTKANNQVFCQRKANGGTPGNFIAAPNAGVGGTLTGTAGDTSTVEWRID